MDAYNTCPYLPLGWSIGIFILALAGGYFLGLKDGLHSRPPVMKGDYDSGEHDDRVEDYPDYE